MDPAAGNVLFFIPDISGYTKFVSETEIRHSQHIIQGLLEALVDANSLGLTVSEFEGDAILFYRTGAPPALDDFVSQARRMFIAFHTLLQKVEQSRVCQCGACAGASGLTLKIVAHAGPASPLRIKDHVKFIGKDIIVAHRLLKNSVPDREYLLLTRELAGQDGGANAALFVDGADNYEEIGEVAYRYMTLGRYRSEVKVEPPKPFVLENPLLVLELSQPIRAPAPKVFAALTDLPGRMKWIEGIKRVEMGNDQGNFIGAHHVCVREGNDPELVTSEVKVTDRTMELWETDTRKMAACRYLLRRTSEDATELTMQFYVRRNYLVKLVFKAFMEKKLRTGFEKSLANLATLCEQSRR
jgi:hypothetical protein